ncbi:UNVERIFIED_CONTAM: hypothetical protein FKN15_049064 [Acipenser sinensis]
MLPRPQDTAPAPHQHTMPETGAAAAPAAAGSNADAETRHRHRSQAEGERAEPATQTASTGVLESTDDHTLLWLLNHIRLGIPELIIQIRHHKHTRVHAFFVTATYENLLRGAEEVGLRKPVKPEFGGGTRNFSCEEDYIYENIENEICFFSSQERQSIIRYWLENLRAKQGESLHNIHFLEGQPILPELAARGVIQQLFPLHEQRILSQLMKSWVQAVCEKQPLDDICDYFGVKIAMYFAWLGFYTTSMLYPAIIGFVLWMLTESDQTSRDICCVVFALFNVVWATLFLERWKRRGAELAYKWGTLDTPAESLEEPRPQFRGVKRLSPITGCEEFYYPPWKRMLFQYLVSLPVCLFCLCFVFLAMLICFELQGVKRLSPITGCEEFYYPPWKRMLFQYLVSLPVCLFCLCFVFLAMLICFELQEFVMGIKELPQATRFIPKIILAITVTACDDVYRKIACWLNDRVSVCQFLSQPFLYRVLSQRHGASERGEAGERSARMLATLLIIRQFLQNVKEVLQPYLYERHKLGELTPKVLWDLLLSSVLKYGRMAAGKAQASPSEQASPGPGSGEKKCLNGGCGVPDEEEEEEEGGEQERQSEDEVESLMDCGLKLRKVNFIEKAERKGVAMAMQLEDSFLEEGSPTMVEKGMDPASLFELCDDIDNGYLETKEAPGEILVAPLAPDGDAPVSLRQRKRSHSAEREESKTKRESWIDPPKETFSSRLTQAEVESCMKKYEDTFQDYQEMFIQFGYVVLFSSAFPLAAMCALINNVIEIRSDAFKLCTGLQRPFGQRVESIGQWQNVMEAMGFVAIVVNCYLISQCGQLQRLFPWLSPEMAIISIVILEALDMKEIKTNLASGLHLHTINHFATVLY